MRNSILGYSKADAIPPLSSVPPMFPMSGKLPLGYVFRPTELGKSIGQKKIGNFQELYVSPKSKDKRPDFKFLYSVSPEIRTLRRCSSGGSLD